jgi:hypothetical protein
MGHEHAFSFAKNMFAASICKRRSNSVDNCSSHNAAVAENLNLTPSDAQKYSA